MKFVLSVLLLFVFCSKSFASEQFTLSSPDLKEGEMIPNKHIFNDFGCSGDNISPALTWKNAPKGTKSFALTVYDPDAPTGSGWWHWVVFNIPASTTRIDANSGIAANSAFPVAQLPEGVIESLTDFGQPGYGGACPPQGDPKHRYIFTLHALDIENIDLPANSMPALVGFSMNGHRLGKAEFTVYYGR